MAAIITTPLKRILISSLITDIKDVNTNRYYIGLGKSDDWNETDTAPPPADSILEERNTRHALQAVKNVTDVSFVVGRTTWSSGAIYSAYSDNVVGQPTQSYYVITDSNEVYICLRQAKDAAGNPIVSTVKPFGTILTDFQTADGYVWKFLYTISALDATKFLAANFLPVQYITETTPNVSPIDQIQQETIQNAAVPGAIIGFRVTSPGTGYTSAPSVTITGDGTGAEATATVSGGVISKIEVKDEAGKIVSGSGYTSAHVVIAGGGGTGAAASIVLGPTAGIGADPREDLRSTAIMLNTKPDGDESGEFTVDNDFRQVSIIKNPLTNTNTALTSTSANALRMLALSSTATGFTPDNIIFGITSGARAYVDKIDGDQVWYHQTEATGFAPFAEGEAIEEADGGGSGVLEGTSADADSLAYLAASMDFLSGDMLYIDNRAAVSRSAEQQEDIKIIIQI